MDAEKTKPPKWSMGILNDSETDEVPGSILLMPKEIKHNEPLGLSHAQERNSASSLPSPYPPGLQKRSTSRSPSRSRSPATDPRPPSARRPVLSRHSFSFRRSQTKPPEKKRTADGLIILEPQPEDSLNDPLNWKSWRRDIALLSLGFYCMIGGGMTPVLASGFTDVAATYGVTVPQVSLTTGLYMMGLGVGSTIFSPTAILYGKRPVYLAGALLFILSSVWCAASPNYTSLLVARIFQGIAISPVECLPSATIAEIFFLHERAYRLGIYTLLLLGGKNLIPLISAAIIQSLEWRWVFWIIALVGGFAVVLLFFFVPETFWDRTPHPRPHIHSKGMLSTIGNLWKNPSHDSKQRSAPNLSDTAKFSDSQQDVTDTGETRKSTLAQRRQQRPLQHVGFAVPPSEQPEADSEKPSGGETREEQIRPPLAEEVYGATTPARATHLNIPGAGNGEKGEDGPQPPTLHRDAWRVVPSGKGPKTPALHDLNSPYYMNRPSHEDEVRSFATDIEGRRPSITISEAPKTEDDANFDQVSTSSSLTVTYTHQLREAPPKTFRQTLKPWNGRLRRETWLKVAIRPFILFAYPAILWSTLVYALSVGWLIVLSESVASIYRNPETYNFNAIQTGLVYISPFIGGILGTAVAGKVSDIIVRFLSRRNDGVYEPEFRLIMAGPVMVSTCIGLMGFGWSAQVRDNYMVPTVMFGVISFGCSLGSTTAITFAVDSYRQYAGEALVTLNFSKNIFHGLVFSLFFTGWLESDGSKEVFLAVGGIQIACLLTTIPMYIYGKRARMWTVRKNMMEKF